MFSKKSFSGRVASITAGVILLVTAFLGAQSAESSDLPGWVLYEEGLSLYDQGKLDQALEYFSLSAGAGDLTPEAAYHIGRIYEEEGDYLLAEKQYEKALEDSRFLYIPEQKWQIRYSLAEVYLNRKEFDRYEQLLLSVFDEEMIRDEETIRREHAYVQMLKESGMDKFLLLFRMKLTYSLEAASQLGVFYSREGAWKSSLIKNLYTVLSFYSGGIDYLIERYPGFSFPVDRDELWENDPEFLAGLYEEYAEKADPDFLYTRDLESLELLHPLDDTVKAELIIRTREPGFVLTSSLYTLRKMEDQPGLKSFLDDERFYRALFYLGLSLYRSGFFERAEEVWKLAAFSSYETPWKILSRKALAEPGFSPSSLIY